MMLAKGQNKRRRPTLRGTIVQVVNALRSGHRISSLSLHGGRSGGVEVLCRQMTGNACYVGYDDNRDNNEQCEF